MPDIPRSRTWLLLAGTIVLQVAIIRSATVLRHGLTPPSSGPGAGGVEPHSYSYRPLRRTSLTSHPQTETQFLSLPYHEWYASSPAYLKPFVAFGYLSLLSFLFSFIGIVASDFFCPNLATIANYLGLSETTAGVTFLAFGNGSPDVFSTFSAMNQGTFSLAIGELIGAATFITSIVVGSIAFIRPFYVPKTAFIRDITFFTAAVIVLVWVLRDGHLSLIESTVMVALYALYVVVVIAMNVLARRRRRPELLAEEEHAWKSLPGSGHLNCNGHGNGNGAISPRGMVEPNTPPTLRPTSLHLPSPHLEAPPTPDDDASSNGSLTPTAGTRPRRRSRSHSHAHLQLHGLSTPDYAETPRANFSLLGAIEFRDVVNSLKRENASRTPSPSRSPYTAIERTDYFSAVTGPGHGHRRSISHAAGNRRSSAQAQYRSRAISHVVQPGSMATFSMTPSDLSPKRASPIRTASAPGHPPLRSSPERPKLRPNSAARTLPNTNESSVSRSPSSSPENPWKDQTGNAPSLPPPRPALPKLDIPEPLLPKRRHGATPSISIMDPSGHVEEPIFSPPQDGDGDGAPSSRRPSTTGTRESRFRIRRRTRMILRVLFPSLQSFRHKSLFGQFLSVFSVPAIFVLTLTLPVVDDGGRAEGGIALPETEDEPMAPDLEPGLSTPPTHEDEEEEEDPFLRPDVGEGLHHLVEGGFSPLHSPLGRIHHSARRVSDAAAAGEEEEEDEEMTKELLEEWEQEQALDFNKPLCAAQCIFGPAFCAYILFGDFAYGIWVVLACLGFGVIAAVAVMRFGTDGTSRTWRMVRCMAGFTCSMVWIAAIADEVVSVLQSIGELMGLSDAIIGLTIFAIGNSMADLVANITVAQFAPAMAYAACFGGPMLNLLLGVGGSGTYHLLLHPHDPVKLHFSPTLWVSATGLIIILLTTAVVVPLNGYLVDRRWAACLVLAYGTLMVANVVVEIKTGRA